jgi:hypothetical protein
MARFWRRGKSLIRFLPAVANPAAPSSAEISAGTNLTTQIAEIAGFNFSANPITTPDLSTTFDTQIPGPDSTDTSTLTFYDDDTSSTIRTALAKGTRGYLLFQPYGSTATKRAEVWHVESTGVNDEWSTGNEAARFAVSFAILDAPTQNAVNP